MDMGDLRGLATVLCMLAFGAVVYWAYGPSRKEYFQEAGEILFDEPEPEMGSKPESDSGKELRK